MELTFPTKGLDTNSARFSQPAGTSPSLLNVLAFDRNNRARGAQRPGTSKMFAAAIGTGSQPINNLIQVTRALDPSSIEPNNTLLNEAFAYSNGNLNTVASANWLVTDISNNVHTGFSVSANTVIASDANIIARYQQSLVLSPSYIVKTTMTWATTSGGQPESGILFRAASSHSGTVSNLALIVGWGGSAYYLTLRDNFSTLSGSPPNVNLGASGNVITTGTPFVLELRVSGNTITGWIDGVQKLSFISTARNTQSTVGFVQIGGSTANVFDNFIVITGSPLASLRQTNLVAVCGGNIYMGDISTQPTLCANGSGVLSETVKVQAATTAGVVYFVDGIHDLQSLDVATATVSTPSITGSETATTLGACTLACIWRGRAVYAAAASNPQNFFMSRQGAPLDFDYSQLDAAAALAGNASKAGFIGEPLNCLIPFSDDILILGGDHQINKVEGDIAAGGQIVVLSDSIGTMGADCWDADPSGTVWFVGTTGLFKIPKGSDQISDVSQGRIKDFFVQIDRKSQYVALAWDRDRNGLWIFITPVASGTATHLFYDALNDAFFPMQFPNNHGPITAITYDGDTANDRVLLLAGRDGFIRKWDTSATNDDGATISSYVFVGPIRPIMKSQGTTATPDEQSLGILEYLDVIFGEPPAGFDNTYWNVDVSVQTGKDAYTALTSPERTFTQNMTTSVRRKKLLQQISGGVFYFKLANSTANKIWQLEKLSCDFRSGGLQRRW